MGWWRDLFRRSSSSRRGILNFGSADIQQQPSPPSQPLQQQLPPLQLEEGGRSFLLPPPHITFSTHPMPNDISSKKNENDEDVVLERDDINEDEHFPSPVSFSVSSSVHSVVDGINERLHHLPKWQYRLLCGSLWLILFLFVILLTVSIIYGFGLKNVHFSVTGVTPLVSTLADTQGNVPLRTTLSLDNPNIFPITASPTTTTISYIDRTNETRTLYPLVRAPVPRIYLHSHEEGHIIYSDLIFKNLGKLPGGPELMTAVLKGNATFLDFTTTLRLRVKALGFVPIVRVFQVDCYISILWGEPTRRDGSKETISDCMGTFL
ncbi:hypothetical protein VYU27_007151 [Nannochloropsis oceanica]